MNENIVPAGIVDLATAATARPGRMQRFARQLLLQRMARLEHGTLEVHDAEGTLRFGQAAE